MLEELYIQNIALIDEVTISFARGFNVMSGETGAGKSIIVDAVNLILGARGDKELVKYGAEKAFVQAQFAPPEDPALAALLEAQGFESGELILSRELSAAGRSVCRVNGRLANLSALREIAGRAINLHGQNQQQEIFEEKNHLDILDRFGGQATAKAMEAVGAAYGAYVGIKRQLEELRSDAAERESRMARIGDEMEEIDGAHIRVGEEAALIAERDRMQNSEELAEAMDTAREALRGGGIDRIRAAAKALERVAGLDAQLQDALERINDAYYTLDDVADVLAEYADGLEYDPQRLDALEERLAELSRLCRKYGATEEDILAYYGEISEKYSALAAGDARIAELEQALSQQKAKLDTACAALSEIRRKKAKQLEREIVRQLGDLGMQDAVFRADFVRRPYSPRGYDAVSFHISVNKGEPARPLAKVVSGGEASRITLAIQNIIATQELVETLIFDEIDAGISGRMANVVARKIANIARTRQVICVTHLPQIAAMGDVNFYISKSSAGKRTRTVVDALNSEEKIREIARMTGGMDTQAAIAHARELCQRAEEEKQALAE